MSWKERLLDQYGYLFNIDGDFTSVCNFIEALIKETEQRIIEEEREKIIKKIEELIKDNNKHSSGILDNEEYNIKFGRSIAYEEVMDFIK
jgi:hypothetical protein